MAGRIPTPAVLLLATAAESAVAIVALKQYLPEHPLVYVFIRLLGLQILGYFVYAVFIYPFYIDPLRHIPGPKGGHFLLGHGMSMLKKPPGSDFALWVKNIPNDGLLYFRGFFNSPRLIVTDPRALGELLVTKTYDFEKPVRVRNFLRNILGDGLIIVEGEDHKFLRKNCMPAFSFRHIKDLYPIFWDKSAQLVEGVAQQVLEKPEPGNEKRGIVEINHWANMVTMDIIGMAAMGRDFRTMKSGQDPLIINYEELLEPTREKQLYFAANVLGPSKIIRRLPWKMNATSKRIERNLSRICLDLVAQKKESMKTESDSDKDILAQLIRTNNFSDRQLSDQLLTFLAAGHETTSSALTWTTYLMAIHPDIQTAMREEIRAAIPSPSEPVPNDFDLAATLESLPLLNGVCNETLRLYPTVPATVRVSVRPTSLIGQALPLDTQVLLVPWAINRSPHLWGADADEFSPRRWIDTDEKTGEERPNNSGGASSNYSNLTFLHGPRSCIGQGFAKAELRAMVAAFVGSFSMEMADPNEKVEPSGVITTKPKNGMHLRLNRLPGW